MFQVLLCSHSLKRDDDTALLACGFAESFPFPAAEPVAFPNSRLSVCFALLALQTEELESSKTQRLDSISPELVQAKKLLQGITVPRRGCLKELAQQKEFVCWVREALKGVCCSSRNQTGSAGRSGSWCGGRRNHDPSASCLCSFWCR